MATKEHCIFCFDVLKKGLRSNWTRRSRRLQVPVPPSIAKEKQKFPLFVTWNIKRGKRWDLRGCIGTFAPLNLEEGLHDYALLSAFEDTRFDPITENEFPKLQCHVSLLTDFEPAEGHMDWEVGKHGIQIHFKDPLNPRKEFSGTFLPEVAADQRWDRMTTLLHLIQKTGYRKTPDEDLLKSIQLTRYQSSNVTLSYDEYLEAKKEEDAPEE